MEDAMAYRKPRQATERLLEMIEEGLLDRDLVIMACVKYMSEDEVADMCHANEIPLGLDEEEDEEGEGQDRESYYTP
jgi:hypothetical protein